MDVSAGQLCLICSLAFQQLKQTVHTKKQTKQSTDMGSGDSSEGSAQYSPPEVEIVSCEVEMVSIEAAEQTPQEVQTVGNMCTLLRF